LTSCVWTLIFSVADVYADIVGGFTDHLDRRYLGELNVHQWSVGVERALKFRQPGLADGPDHRFHDIDFRAMQADPIGEVRRLYAWLGEPVTDAFEQGMATWWAENADKREPHTPSDPRDFGLDTEAIRPMFATYVGYMQRWIAHER
jgi:sulfotransferase family protein